MRAVLGWCACWMVLAIPAQAHESLRHWYAGPTQRAIVDFVQMVSNPKDPHFVPEAERIAVFDNDGTLWAEQPHYFPVMFAMDLVRERAAQHPEWETTDPYARILHDPQVVLSAQDLRVVQQEAFAGDTPEVFAQRVHAWLDSAENPLTHMPYRRMAYVPMLELLEYLRKNHFTVVLSSGAETDFLRAVAERLYHVPAPFAIGSDLVTVPWPVGRGLQLLRTPAWAEPINERGGKAANLHRHLGMRPILACGNSNGDIELLQYADRPDRPSLSLLLHHDDPHREFAYDAGAETALVRAAQHGWTVISMQRDFRQVFGFQAADETP